MFLSKESLTHIASSSLSVLEKTGVLVKNTKAVSLLKEAGCTTSSGRTQFPSELVVECIKKAPSEFNLFSGDGKKALSIGRDDTIFNPGSSAVYFKDHQSREFRKATLQDMENVVNVVNHLDHIEAQSTAVIPSNVPEPVSEFLCNEEDARGSSR